MVEEVCSALDSQLAHFDRMAALEISGADGDIATACGRVLMDSP
jgi:hypothetical protein